MPSINPGSLKRRLDQVEKRLGASQCGGGGASEVRAGFRVRLSTGIYGGFRRNLLGHEKRLFWNRRKDTLLRGAQSDLFATTWPLSSTGQSTLSYSK